VDVTLLPVKQRDKCFLAIKTIQQLFALLVCLERVCLERILLRFVELLTLAMCLPKRGWQGKLLVKKVFAWAEKSAAQGERDGFYYLGFCYLDGTGCVEDVERAKENFLVAAELGDVYAMVCFGELLGKDDPQRFVWFGRATAMEQSSDFLNEMGFQIRNFNSGTGYAKIVFVIGRALKGHINNEERTVFGNSIN
jgi:TPR repeat protein